jgi:hypothetical protein
MQDHKLALSVEEFARSVPLSKARVYQLLNEGKLCAVHCGAKTLILVEEANRFLGSLPAAPFPAKRRGDR